MEYDNDEGFPGLYNADSGKRSNESDYSDGDHDKPSKKELLIGRRKDKKDSKKDRGYAALEGESSPEEETETKSPSKSKKTKAFKFPSKSKEKREKSRDKEKVGEKDAKDKEKEHTEKEKKKEKLKKEKEKREKEKVKEKEKEEKNKTKESKEKVKEKEKAKEKEKEKSKDKDRDKKERKASKQQTSVASGVPFEEICTLGVLQPVFGAPLGLAVERSGCHDDSHLPLVVRHCVDFLQERVYDSDAVFRAEPPREKLRLLKKLYNDREAVAEKDYDVPTACFLLATFLSELPEPVLTTELLPQFEEAAASERPDELASLVSRLPTVNAALLGRLLDHMARPRRRDRADGPIAETPSAPLGGALEASDRLLSLLVENRRALFPDLKVSKYAPPLTSTAELPETADEIAEELRKQESMLNQIHAEMHAGFVTQKREEQLWEGQRIVTQLKRKLRAVRKPNDSSSFTRTRSSTDERQATREEEAERTPRADTPEASVSEVEKPRSVAKSGSDASSVESKAFARDKPTPESDSARGFASGSFEDNFDDPEETAEPDAVDSEPPPPPPKAERPTLSEEELGLMRLQLERAEYSQLKSLLQAKIDSERFEIVKLRSHVAIKSKQEGGGGGQSETREAESPSRAEAELEERRRLVVENRLLERKRLSLADRIFQERMACVQLKIQLAMNEIL